MHFWSPFRFSIVWFQFFNFHQKLGLCMKFSYYTFFCFGDMLVRRFHNTHMHTQLYTLYYRPTDQFQKKKKKKKKKKIGLRNSHSKWIIRNLDIEIFDGIQYFNFHDSNGSNKKNQKIQSFYIEEHEICLSTIVLGFTPLFSLQ